MENIKNPHDLYFKTTMSKVPNAQSFVANYLPESVSCLLDIQNLQIEKDTFVAPELSEYFSDMIYRVPLRGGGDSYVYILVEHKSYQEHWVALQLLEYMLHCWQKTRQDYLEQKKQKQPDAPKIEFHLPLIIPIVLYHGAGQWQHSDNLAHLFDCDPALHRFIPDFSYVLCDLIAKSEQEICGIATLQIMLRVLKFIRTPMFQAKADLDPDHAGRSNPAG